MSRSNPTEHSQHPCTRWFEWDGSNGGLRYYDKSAKQNIEVPDGFTFILLDQLATVKGWHDASDSGIYANEVRDTKQEVLIVKAFKAGTIAEGFYASIRDRVNAFGGYYMANLYIAYRGENGLALGSLHFKGAALSVWMEFQKANRSDLYKKSIQIKGHTEGKKGKIVFRTPKFFIREITPETDAAATELDRGLQTYLKTYLSRTKSEQVEQRHEEHEPEHQEEQREPEPDEIPMDHNAEEPSDLPF